MDCFIVEIAYEEVAEGLPWLAAAEMLGLFPGLPIPKRVRALQFEVRKYARMYSRPWPLGRANAHKSYILARWGASWQGVADSLDYLSPKAAEEAAFSFAQKHNRRWPPATTSVGKDAYWLRRDKGLSWRDISDLFASHRRNIHSRPDWVGRAAKKYAEECELAWPVVPRLVVVSRNTGEISYDLRSTQFLEWEDISAQLEVGEVFARRKAQEYAYENNLSWPVMLPGGVEQRAYDLRMTGISWQAVADAEGVYIRVAKGRAKKYARSQGKEWPPAIKPVRLGHSAKAEVSYRLGYVEKKPWKIVAAELGYSSCQSAINSAKIYAQRTGLPYLVQSRTHWKRDGARRQQSYEMRLFQPGISWAQISKVLEYKTYRGSHTAAKQWAQQKGLPWPPTP